LPDIWWQLFHYIGRSVVIPKQNICNLKNL
jgi:hypothetical protein